MCAVSFNNVLTLNHALAAWAIVLGDDAVLTNFAISAFAIATLLHVATHGSFLDLSDVCGLAPTKLIYVKRGLKQRQHRSHLPSGTSVNALVFVLALIVMLQVLPQADQLGDTTQSDISATTLSDVSSTMLSDQDRQLRTEQETEAIQQQVKQLPSAGSQLDHVNGPAGDNVERGKLANEARLDEAGKRQEIKP